MFRILVVVLIVVGALYWWARPMCSCTYKETAYMAAVRSDLRNLATAQEIFFADSVRYSRSMDALEFDPTPGVTISFLAVTDSGWSAIGIHRNVSGWCAMFLGNAAPPVEEAKEAEPACRWAAQGSERWRGMADSKEP